MIKKTFDFVYKDLKNRKHAAHLECCAINPTFEFLVKVGKESYHCFVEKMWTNEWIMHIVTKTEIALETELSHLNDVFWNSEAVYELLQNEAASIAISQGLSDLYDRYMWGLNK